MYIYIYVYIYIYIHISLKGVHTRIKALEEMTGAVEAASAPRLHGTSSTLIMCSSNLKRGIEGLNRRVDALDCILLGKVKDNKAKEIETALQKKYAYSFDFSRERGDTSGEAPSSQHSGGGDRIYADKNTESRVFDVQKMEIYAATGAGGVLQRRGSGRIPRPQSARTHRFARMCRCDVHVCMCAFVYVVHFICVGRRIFVNRYRNMYICIYIYMYIYIYIYTYMYMYKYLCTYVYIRMYVYMYTYVHTYIYVWIYIYMNIVRMIIISRIQMHRYIKVV